MSDLRQDGRISAEKPHGYDDLPASVRALYSEREYLWLSDAEKATLVQRETEPDWIEP